MRDYRLYAQAVRGRELPLAFVDLDGLAQNIASIVTRSHPKQIRLASKSLRSVAILQHIFDADPAYAGILCFTAPEAVWLSSYGFADLVVGYPTWNLEQIQAVCERISAGHAITLMLDSLEHVQHLAAIAATAGVVLPVCIDMDLSLDVPGLHFGVWRSPLRSLEHIILVVEAIARRPSLRLDGVMGYEAQIAGVGDNVPHQHLKNRLIRLLKRLSVRDVANRRAAVVGAIEARGIGLRFVNGGGTGSLESTATEAAVTEVTAGSGFFAPSLFDYYTGFRHLPAAGFALEIVRQPTADVYTCLGGGYIASGSAGWEKLPVPYLPAGVRLLPLEGAGEVQTPITYNGPERLQLGDPIFFRHSKAGELCERFNTLHLIANNTIIDEVPTYRGQGVAFL